MAAERCFASLALITWRCTSMKVISAFALLGRISERVDRGMKFDEALERVRATSVFTSHTPVPAGHDIFPVELIDRYFKACYPALGIDREDFLQLGVHPQNPNSGFNMTAFALRMSEHHNAVSRTHGAVTRQMWRCLWPESPETTVPIDHVTNGIHVPTWLNHRMKDLYDRYIGPTSLTGSLNMMTRRCGPSTRSRMLNSGTLTPG